MSMSILYHAFGIKGVTYRSTYYLGNAVLFRVETTDHHVRCPKCGQNHCIFRGPKTRWLRMPPIGRKQAILELIMHRLQCKNCENLWWPRLPFMLGTARYTRSFALTVLDLLHCWTISAVAKYLPTCGDQSLRQRALWELIEADLELRIKSDQPASFIQVAGHGFFQQQRFAGGDDLIGQ